MVIIRLATKEDKNSVLALLDELLTSIERKSNDKTKKHEPVEKVGRVIYDELLEKDALKIFVAENDGEVVGVATFFRYPVMRRGHYRGQLEDMVVTETMRGKGIGSKLLQTVINYCRENNIPTMRLNSGLELTNAHAFYEKHGGKFTERMYRFDL